MIGETISHYKILEELGRGGMGIVYKAHDTKLDRDVALKFLPSHLSASEQDKARFIQEAKAAATLDHPNICTIFSIDEHQGPAFPGAPAGKQLFIAMQLVEGQTLRDLLVAQPARTDPASPRAATLHLKRAIDIGIQIADGLAAAHEKGIVHRDIKPENIMVRKDGIVQIMDFGLAKLRGDVSRLTKEGSTVGTAGYMSPEQVQGQDADHRSDIFSLGVLLYELFSGKLPFNGVHETALLYEIVNVDAPSIASIRPEIDPVLDAVVLECLGKDPAERYQSAAEVSKELRRYKRESGRSGVIRASRVAEPRLEPAQSIGRGIQSTKKERFVWAGVVALLLISLTFLLFRGTGRDDSPRLAMRFTIPAPEGTIVNESAVSPDGKTIVFTTTGKGENVLWVRHLNGVVATPVPGTKNSSFPFWSPDGRYVGFFADGRMKKVDLLGGEPIVICDVSEGRGGAWNSDGEILFSHGSGGLYRVSSAGGIARQVTFLDSSRKETSHRWPSFLPDGKHFLFLALRVFDEESSTFVSSLDDTARIPLITSEANVLFAPPSHILYLRNRTLMSQKFDPGSRQLTGDPSPVAVGVGHVPNLVLGDFSYSSAGILTTGGGRSVNRQYAWFDRSGKQSGSASPPGNYFDIALSPSGNQAAIQRGDIQTGNSDIWIIDLPRALISRFTFDPAVEDDPVWSADGKYVYYSNAREGTYDIYRKISTGVGSPEVVAERGLPRQPRDWSNDGKYLLYEVTDPVTHSDIWVLPADTTQRPFPFLSSQFDESYPRFSPDGRWVAYASDESGNTEIYVQSFPVSGGRWQVSTHGGSQPRWRQDGRELFYVAPDVQLMAVEIRAGAAFDYGEAKPLFQTRIDNYTAPNRYVPLQNGQKFLINIPVEEELANPITVSVYPFE